MIRTGAILSAPSAQDSVNTEEFRKHQNKAFHVGEHLERIDHVKRVVVIRDLVHVRLLEPGPVAQIGRLGRAVRQPQEWIG